MTNFKGKVAIITGSTSGIGLGIAEEFAKHGINVVINGIAPKEDVEKILTDLKKHGIQASFHPADMTKHDEIKDLIHSTVDTYGAIDILVNNAGIQNVCAIEEFPEEKWKAIIEINLSSAFHTMKHAIPFMKKQGGGRIINIGSAHSLVASPFKSAYVAAKHGILGLAKTCALENAEHNITCNVICPGYVLTPLVEKQIPDTAKARGITEEEVVRDVLLATTATKKFTTTEQLGQVALFLCSPAADNITGIALPVDGGWTAE